MASNTMREEKFNNYIEDLKVFEDLLLMSDEEIEKERKAAQDILDMRNGKNKEKEELEAYFAELDQKEVVTGIERLQRIEKEKRYNQILEAEMPKEAREKIEETVTSDKFRSELERYTVFTKVKEPLSLAEKAIIDARNSKAARLKEARREFRVAREQDNIALFNINRKLEELDKYFEDFFKKEYTTEEEQKEFEEKKQSQKELLEAKINFPSKATIDARNIVENIRRNAKENQIMNEARQKIKFMTDRSNWNQILTMSKEELIDFVNRKETSKPETVKPTTPEQAPAQDAEEEQVQESEGQEGAEAKADEKGGDKKETPVKTAGVPRRGEAPVASGVSQERNEELEEDNSEEIDDPNKDKSFEEDDDLEKLYLDNPRKSIWERISGVFAKFGKTIDKAKKRVRIPSRVTRKTKKEERDIRYKKYIENYRAMYKQEPGLIDKGMAKIAPNFFAQVRNVLEYREPINPEDYKGTQAEELAEKVNEKGQELEKIEGEIVSEGENSEIIYEGTQAQELAEKVAASKRIGENPWDRTSSYTKKMTVEQVIEQEDNLQTIDESYEQKSNPVVRVNTDYRDDFSDEPKKVEAVIKVNTDYQAPEPNLAEQEKQAVDSRKSVVSKWKKQYEVRQPQDLKKSEVATFGLRGSKDKGMTKKEFNSIMEGINRAGEAKGREARGETPKPTTPSHGDEGR